MRSKSVTRKNIPGPPSVASTMNKDYVLFLLTTVTRNVVRVAFPIINNTYYEYERVLIANPYLTDIFFQKEKEKKAAAKQHRCRPY